MHPHHPEGEPHHRHHHDHLTVRVLSPRVPEPKSFTWPCSMLVGEAAKEAAKAFEYHPHGAPGLETAKHHKVLDNQKSLHDAGVHEHEELELIDTGGGV